MDDSKSSTCQLPPYSFVSLLDNRRNTKGLFVLADDFWDSLSFAFNATLLVHQNVDTYRLFIVWKCKGGILVFPRLKSCLSLKAFHFPLLYIFFKFLSFFSCIFPMSCLYSLSIHG